MIVQTVLSFFQLYFINPLQSGKEVIQFIFLFSWACALVSLPTQRYKRQPEIRPRWQASALVGHSQSSFKSSRLAPSGLGPKQIYTRENKRFMSTV